MARTSDSQRHGALREFLVERRKEAACAKLITLIAPQASPMKKPKPKARTVSIRARMKPSVKAMAEQLAQKDARSLADWLERLIAAEKARRDGKK